LGAGLVFWSALAFGISYVISMIPSFKKFFSAPAKSAQETLSKDISELQQYILDARKSDIPEGKIKSILLQSGWSETEISKAIK